MCPDQFCLIYPVTPPPAAFPCSWDPHGIKVIANAMGMNLTAFVATHYHWDHIGGAVPYEPFKSAGQAVPGLATFISEFGLPG